MTMDPDTPLRLNLSLGEENVELRKFFEDSVDAIKPVKVAIQTSVIRDPETGRWSSISTEVNYNQKLNQEAREDEHNYYKQQNDAMKSQSKDSNKKTMINPDGTINTPEFMKASKQYKNKASYK